MSHSGDETRILQMRAIAELQAIADDLDVDVWLRGGWAVDFTVGRITRSHEDIDWFAPANSAPALVAALTERGFTLSGFAPPAQQADLVRGAVEHGIAWVHIDERGEATVAGGRWRGEPWPEGMLDGPTRVLDGASVRVISPKAQITIKEMTPVWQPHLARRAKDADDIDLLRSHLAGLRSERRLGLPSGSRPIRVERPTGLNTPGCA